MWVTDKSQNQVKLLIFYHIYAKYTNILIKYVNMSISMISNW